MAVRHGGVVTAEIVDCRFGVAAAAGDIVFAVLSRSVRSAAVAAQRDTEDNAVGGVEFDKGPHRLVESVAADLVLGGVDRVSTAVSRA